MILFLHNAYRTTGGEERVLRDIEWLVTQTLEQHAEQLLRDSSHLSRTEAARGLLRGGLDEDEVERAVRRHGATVVHAHNLLPAFGWRALAAAQRAGARTVLHLHNYRLVCAVGTCFTKGEDCTRCHGRNTLPGVRLNCRGTGREALVYATALARWQRRMVEHADAIVVPSRAAEQRLRELGAPLGDRVHVISHVVRDIADEPAFDPAGPALVASRLAPEKGVDIAITACEQAGVPLVVAGDGPLRARLERPGVTFTGRITPDELTALRRTASVAVVPSRSAETFGLAAAEALAAGLPVAATRIGALTDLLPEDQLAVPGDPASLAEAITRVRGDAERARAGIERIRATAAPGVVAEQLRRVYGI